MASYDFFGLKVCYSIIKEETKIINSNGPPNNKLQYLKIKSCFFFFFFFENPKNPAFEG